MLIVRIVTAANGRLDARTSQSLSVTNRQILRAPHAFMNVKGRRWAHIPGGTGCLIAPVTPNQNLYVESYNGRFRYECLNEHWCTSLAHAKVRIDGWRREDYEERPTKGLAGLTPAPLRQAVGSETQYRHPRTLNRSATQNGGTSGGRSRAPGRIGGAPACTYEGSVRASWHVMGTKWGTKLIYSKHNILIINHLVRVNGGEGGSRIDDLSPT